MKWILETAYGKDNCNFNSIATAVSRGVRKEIGFGDLEDFHVEIRREAKAHLGINKVQRFTHETSGKVLFVIQRFSEDDIQQIMKEQNLTEDEVRRHNEQFFIFAEEIEIYDEYSPENWFQELDTEYLMELNIDPVYKFFKKWKHRWQTFKQKLGKLYSSPLSAKE